MLRDYDQLPNDFSGFASQTPGSLSDLGHSRLAPGALVGCVSAATTDHFELLVDSFYRYWGIAAQANRDTARRVVEQEMERIGATRPTLEGVTLRTLVGRLERRLGAAELRSAFSTALKTGAAG